MVARILLINEQKTDLSDITLSLQKSYNSLLFSKSVEDSLRIVGTQSIDLVLFSLPETSSKMFLDFFSVLRQLCGVIPIIGVLDSQNSSSIKHFSDIGLDDFIDISINHSYLASKVEASVNLKKIFDDNLLSSMYFTEKRAQKMVTIFHNNLDFINDNIRQKTEIVQINCWPIIDDISDADLFLINVAGGQAFECCANLRLRKTNKYKPIVISYSKESEDKAFRAVNLKIGCTDTINTSVNPIIISCRLNSLMKYKKMYESLSEKLKKSIYLSAIDSVTGVYNRSFFDEYMENQCKKLKNSAILIIDIDKFKLVNDQYGHSFADSMLKYVSSTIKRYIRSSDLIARYGGDEFVIYMDNVMKNTATNVAHRIQKTVENSPFKDANCTVSIGVCYIGNNQEDLGLSKAISIADEFMYIAKQNGGNSVHVCA